MPEYDDKDLIIRVLEEQRNGALTANVMLTVENAKLKQELETLKEPKDDPKVDKVEAKKDTK